MNAAAKNKEPKGMPGWMILVILMLLMLGLCIFEISKLNFGNSYQEYNQAVADNADIVTAVVTTNSDGSGKIALRLKDGTIIKTTVTDTSYECQKLGESGVDFYVKRTATAEIFVKIYLPILFVLCIVFLVFNMIMAARAGDGVGNSPYANFGKSRARKTMPGDRDSTFADVAGLEEEKEELCQIVDFLKEPEKYVKLGAKIPKGLLLVGPPGNGKTLLAKAVAGEAGVPFFSISGSDFMEMFVGVGASRVRNLFKDAKDNAPCIIFIDEIDAIGRKRGTGMGGGHDEREQTLNQMLVEMDGFETNSGIIVMAATNRADILDPALMRPGRFDRRIVVQRPDVKARLAILNVHANKKPLSMDVDLERVARTTSGFTGADLANLLNEAAIIAATKGERFITQEDIDEAFVKVGIGTEKKTRVISEKDKRITAYHESGHALLFHLLPDVGPVHTISIIPTSSGAAGFTMPLPGADEMFDTKGRMYQQILVSLGGRIAEEMVFDDVTTGASQDIKDATRIARSMVTQFGFSDSIGPINYGESEEEVFLGRDLAHTKSFSEQTSAQIDEEVTRIIKKAYAEAKALLEEHRAQLEACAELLIRKEKIYQDEFEALF